jgi:transposase-like protein
MDTYGVDLMGRRRRRRHSAEFKAAVIQECMTPGVSIAALALAHSLNATRRARGSSMPSRGGT